MQASLKKISPCINIVRHFVVSVVVPVLLLGTSMIEIKESLKLFKTRNSQINKLVTVVFICSLIHSFINGM